MKTIKNAMRVVKGARSYIQITRDPNRLDKVFALSDEVLRHPDGLGPIVEFLEKDERTQRPLEKRTRLGSVDLKELQLLPEGTLGRTFADHMISRGLSLDAIPSLDSENKLAFVAAHLYETHDIWHVVTGFETDVAGELGLQAFYLSQLPGALAAVILSSGLLNAALYNRQDLHARMGEIVRGWQLGRNSKPLFGTEWATMWARPIAEVRAELGLAA